MAFRCVPQNLSKISLAVLFSVLALGAVVVGITALPVIGLLLAVPFIGLAYYFYRVHLTRQCNISDETDETGFQH